MRFSFVHRGLANLFYLYIIISFRVFMVVLYAPRNVTIWGVGYAGWVKYVVINILTV